MSSRRHVDTTKAPVVFVLTYNAGLAALPTHADRQCFEEFTAYRDEFVNEKASLQINAARSTMRMAYMFLINDFSTVGLAGKKKINALFNECDQAHARAHNDLLNSLDRGLIKAPTIQVYDRIVAATEAKSTRYLQQWGVRYRDIMTEHAELNAEGQQLAEMPLQIYEETFAEVHKMIAHDMQQFLDQQFGHTNIIKIKVTTYGFDIVAQYPDGPKRITSKFTPV